MKVKTKGEIRELILTRGPLGPARNAEIYHSAFRNLPPQRIQLPLKRYALGEKKVLDVGCEFGAHLFFWGDGSLGIELDQEEVQFAQAVGLNVIQCDIENATDMAKVSDNAFDAVWCSHLLEHLEAPHGALKMLLSKLREDGLLFLVVPIIPQNRVLEWLWKVYFHGLNTYDADEHLYAFTVRTVAYLVEKAGYELIERNIFYPPLGPLNDYANALIGASWKQTTLVAKKRKKSL